MTQAGRAGRVLRHLAATILLAAVLAGCEALDGGAEASGAAGPLTVSAAASLRDVGPRLAAAWEDSRPDAPLVIAHDGSDRLAAQIAQGAPVDVFISADAALPRSLIGAGHARGEAVAIAASSIVLVVPAGSSRIAEAADLARPGIRLVAAGEGVPITRYADELIGRLAETRPDPDAFLAAVAANIVSREDNVRAALAKVELGEGDAAFVYEADVRASDATRLVPLPAGVAVSSEVVAVRVSDHPAADDLVAWLAGPKARAILDSAGFVSAARDR